jgi:hypothetical protein
MPAVWNQAACWALGGIFAKSILACQVQRYAQETEKRKAELRVWAVFWISASFHVETAA